MPDRLEYVLCIARNDDNIRAVVLYGSRANIDIVPDKYQDYDIIFIANNKDIFDISIFKNIKIKFMPSKAYPELFHGNHTYLLLFDDDSRIDLSICNMEFFLSSHANGQPMKSLLDKDKALCALPEVDKSLHWIKPMDEETYNNTCAEFFWEIQNMVKGMKRDELSFAMFIRDVSLRDMLNRMIDAYIGMNYDYKVSVGTLGKYRKKYLPDRLYEMYLNTYLSNTTKDKWDSLYYMIDLFTLTGKYIAKKYHYIFPEEDEEYIRYYVDRMMR
jgi:aminoglycoside 6-adenylyltransferase